MIDKSLRSLERLQDPLKLKLLQRRLGQSVYIQEFPRPIKVFNSTELLVNISKNDDEAGHGFQYGDGYGTGSGGGRGDDDGDGYGDGSGNGSGGRSGWGHGWGYGDGYGFGSESGDPEGSYTQDLRKKHNG